jgi:hypothetical protein
MKAKKDRVGALSCALSLALTLSLWGTAHHLSYCGAVSVNVCEQFRTTTFRDLHMACLL